MLCLSLPELGTGNVCVLRFFHDLVVDEQHEDYVVRKNEVKMSRKHAHCWQALILCARAQRQYRCTVHSFPCLA